MGHTLFILAYMEGHLTCFPLLDVVTSATVNTVCKYLLKPLFSVPLLVVCISPKWVAVLLLVLVLFFTFGRTGL